MKIEYTLEELLAMESSENKKRIQEKSERLKEDYLLTQIRKCLKRSLPKPSAFHGLRYRKWKK